MRIRNLDYLASMTRAGAGDERRQEVTEAIRLTLEGGGCLRSGSRASRARHLKPGIVINLDDVRLTSASGCL